ncbi:hypothetical protein Glove_450g31 [Diversispora epigaea]|uniref:Uncharacterized protein n=1 Tax=Diversispora epigaea TaxID=1348612 RepID=A0A397GUC2_9GLOM|nr:hypothetical protein Glove_450g31 [Diversispora epigaea]
MNNNMDNSTSTIASTSTTPTRKRGRPRKEKAVPTTQTTSTITPVAPTKKRKRPKKIQKVEDKTTEDLHKFKNIKNFIMKNYPSVANNTENIATASSKSMEMARNLWEKVIKYEEKYLV